MANLITLSRFPLLLIFILLTYLGDHTLKLVAVPLLIVLLAFDTLDGLVARHRKETSLLGSVIDIAADRTVELLLWVMFSDLRLISVAIPLTVIARGTTVDAVRGVGLSQGHTPFGMMRTKWGKRLVGSRFMRSTYGMAKFLAFVGLSSTIALLSFPSTSRWYQAGHTVGFVAAILSWLALLLSLARGLPVLIEGVPLLKAADRPHAETGN